jgi:hypothetical protein
MGSLKNLSAVQVIQKNKGNSPRIINEQLYIDVPVPLQ